MTGVLLLALTMAPFLAPCVVVITAAVLARRGYARPPGTWRRLPGAGTCVLIAVMSGAAAFGAYAWGVMSGFYVLDPDQLCASRGAEGDHIVTHETLPVSVQCITSDGTGTELVPDWVNPVIFTGLTLFALSLVIATVSGVRGRRTPFA
jgi:hypothetical protein